MKKGDSIITIPILLVFSTIAISVVGIVLINILKPYIMYEKLLSTTVRYMFVLEEYGYLTKQDKQLLYNELVGQGFNGEKLVIVSTDSPKAYGDTVELRISYEYILELPVIINNSLAVNQQEIVVPMNIVKYGISKI